MKKNAITKKQLSFTKRGNDLCMHSTKITRGRLYKPKNKIPVNQATLRKMKADFYFIINSHSLNMNMHT